MLEQTRADSYYATLQGLVGLGSSAADYESMVTARAKAKQEALQAMKDQARLQQQLRFNVNVNGVDGGGGPQQTSGGRSLTQFGIFPVKNYRLSSKFGPRTNPVTGKHGNHTGMDFATGSGSPIYAVADGTVKSSLFDRIYGNQTILDFGGGVSSMYGHQSKSIVKPGQKVKKGQIIGYVGSTGRSTGPHLHFETWVNNKPVNPLSWFIWN